MPSTVELDVDAEAERGNIHSTAEEGSNEGTPMDMASEVVQQSKKSESISSKKQVMGEGAEKNTKAPTQMQLILMAHQQVPRRRLFFK